MDLEMIIMQLIVEGGNARSEAIEAIRCARDGDFSAAEEHIRQCDKCLTEAHNAQTGLLHNEADGNETPVKLLMVHAQDHLMNAITVHDLAVEIIEILKKGEMNQ